MKPKRYNSYVLNPLLHVYLNQSNLFNKSVTEQLGPE